MIRIVDGKIKWSERDLVAMTSIIGPDSAVEMQSPINPSILKLADKHHLVLSNAARKRLRAHIELRHKAKSLKKLKDAPPASKLEKKCFAHQRVDLHFLRSMGLPSYLNSSETGVGKTLVALLWAHEVVKAKKVLIITKNMAKEQWRDAIRNWISQKERIRIVGGTIPKQLKKIKSDNRWIIGHWESLQHGAKDGYRDIDWDVIILDEGHHIYNRKTIRANIAFRLHAKHKMVATAHPFDKDPGQMLALLRFMYPALYRSYWRFFHMHVRALPKAFGGFEILGVRRPKLLRWELEPFTIRHTKRSVFKNLPPVTRIKRVVELTARGQKEYNRLKKQFFAELDALGGGTKFVPIINDLTRLTRLRQYLIDPGLIGGREKSLKYPAVLEQLEEIGKPTVVFTSFEKAAKRLGRFLTDYKLMVGHIDGKVKFKEKMHAKRAFLNGELDVLIVVRQSGDEALNLGKYGYYIDLDLPWTQKGVEQEEGRVDRPEENTGKLVPTTAYRFIVKNSYEERLEKRINKQRRTFRSVITVGDLREMFE